MEPTFDTGISSLGLFASIPLTFEMIALSPQGILGESVNVRVMSSHGERNSCDTNETQKFEQIGVMGAQSTFNKSAVHHLTHAWSNLLLL